MLQLKDIVKKYVTASETVEALKGVTLSFRQKEFVSILGPSGCGKTTMLNIIGGLDHYTSGDLLINGRSTKEYTDRDWDVYRNHRIGFIFQSYNLIPHQTILGNVELALTIAGMSKEERIEKAKRALDRVGLSGQYYKRPNQLSGGQCQRVAIARALVNDPEILLADEPTGALDTVTSKQIMDLIKEISGERLVIMVTHNPDIAEEYSTRIIRLLDGQVLEDTNPFSAEDEAEECRINAEKEAKELATEEAEATTSGKKTKAKKEKAKMSFFTAFKLSARNLLSKKGRTAMVGFAGSIGIIGIAMVLAFSAGIKGYVASMQDDMLSGNPIEIAETAYDLNAFTGMMNNAQKLDIVKEPNRVYISSLVEYLATTYKNVEDIVTENEITEEYIEYLKAMPEEYYQAILLEYGMSLDTGIFTDFKYNKDSDAEHISLKRLTDIYTSVLQQTEFSQAAYLIPMLAPSMKQAPANTDYLLSQYDLVGGGKVAEGKNEVMLVLNSEDELSDLLLAKLGYYTQTEFMEIVYKATSEDGTYDESLYREYFTYDELLGKTFTWYPADTIFTKKSEPSSIMPGVMPETSYQYNSIFAQDNKGEGALELTVVGILTPKENVNFGSITSGIYYTEELTDHILETNSTSIYINDYLTSDLAKAEIGHLAFPSADGHTTSALYYATPYAYTYYYDADNKEKPANPSIGFNVVSPVTTNMSDMMGQMMSGESTVSLDDMRDLLIRNLGGNSLANRILIYPISFDDKNLVTEYLDYWNDEDKTITVNGTALTFDDRHDVTYTDTLELVISIINTMIDVVSYALIAFTSISLVVSTVMIGIITYVSVVERIKEIGVIRSLGGRKKDVRHLFNAETFIIGLLAGLFGVGVTYLASVIVNLILTPIINYSGIAALPFYQAIILVVLSIGLTCISGLIPASSAAKKDPVVALRTE